MQKKTYFTDEQMARIRELQNMTPQQWDNVCKKCGVCCLDKTRYMGQVIFLNLGCEHLNCKTKLCNVFKTRQSVNKAYCAKQTINTVLTGQMVPDSCGYREYIFGPATHPAKPDFQQVRPISYIDVLSMDEPQLAQYVIPESVKWQQERRLTPDELIDFLNQRQR